MTIEERLTRLERKNRRLTLALFSVGLAAVFAVAVGMAAPEAVLEEIKAHKFSLVDGDGKVRASLAVTKGGSGLFVFDDNGKMRVNLGVDKVRSGLCEWDGNGKARVGLFVDKRGPALSTWDGNGNALSTWDCNANALSAGRDWDGTGPAPPLRNYPGLRAAPPSPH